ncbi:C40 family peptidase [Paenibacillus sp. 1P07SE]|uniref:C40 family peptidase n=1 Tax=Paenibacillus sp. 1P07SE TaxID=3132209 RepID=UPI0039A4FAAD
MQTTRTLIKRVISVTLCATISFTAFGLGQTNTAQASTKADRVISTGNKYLGVKYRFGAPAGVTYAFDCSSFTQYIFKKNGISLPRTSAAQAQKGSFVSKSNLKKGDLVFFKVGSKRIGHVAVYAGASRILHTYGAGGVRYSSLNSSHWKKNYVTARRVIR